MAYDIVEFSNSIDLAKCKVNQPSRLIFLCGGKIAKRGPYQSARDFFYRQILRNHKDLAARVKLAEEVATSRLVDRKIFTDLLQLEDYLADLSTITILFVESPGSIAELGAFAASASLSPKTLAVLNDTHGIEGSFIIDGPVARLRSHNLDLVHYFTWNSRNLQQRSTLNEFRAITTSLIADIAARDAAASVSLSLVPTSKGHAMLLVADLIGLAGAVTITDIVNCLAAVGIPADREEAHRFCSLLLRLGFISEVRRSTQSFFVSDSPTRFLDFAFKPNATERDMSRITSLVRSSLDDTRKQAFARSRRHA